MGNLKKQIGFKVKQKFKTEIKNGIDMQKVADKFVNYCHQNNISTLYEVNHSTIKNYLTQENYNPSDKLFVERIFTDKRLEIASKKTFEPSKPLGVQIHYKMQSMLKIGASKHDDKMVIRSFARQNNLYVNPLKNGGIHSYQTYTNYKQTSIEFTKWLEQKYPDVKNIDQINKDHAKEYLLSRQEKGLSSWTTDKDLAALNKVFEFNMTKKEVGLDRKRYTDSVRSRKDSIMDSKYNPKNYENQITVAQATGIRRQSMLKITSQNFNRDITGKIISITVKEKGGKTRDAKVLEKYQDRLTKIVDNLIKEKGQYNPLFDKYTSRIDNHAFRAEYARNLYKELIEKKGSTKNDFYGYDKQIVKEVSQNLGHERETIVIQSYFR